MRNIAIKNCAFLSFFFSDDLANVDCVGLLVTQSTVNDLVTMDAGQKCRINEVEVYDLSQRTHTGHLVRLTTAIGGNFELRDWYIHDTTLYNDKFVGILASTQHSMIEAIDWQIERVTANAMTMLACSGAPLFATGWLVTDSTLLSAISFSSSDMTLTNSSFTNLTVTEVIHAGDASFVAIHGLTVFNVSATKAVILGDSVARGESVALVLDASAFSSCSGGPVITLQLGQLALTDSIFSNNHHDFMIGAFLRLLSSFTNVTVTKDADKMSVPSVIHGNFAIENSTFYDALASTLKLESESDHVYLAVFQNCRFDGVSIDSQVEVFHAVNCTFLGGELPNDSGSNIGSLRLSGSTQTALLEGCHFCSRRNVSQGKYSVPVGQPGAISVDPDLPAVVIIEHSFFVERVAYEGAALFSKNANVTLLHTEIRSNAGAVYMQDGTLELSYCRFFGNFAFQVGGDVVATGTSHMLLADNSFEHSTSLSSGGSLYFSDTVTGTAANLSLVHCRAVDGGAVAMTGDSDVIVFNATISDCVADSSGGAVSFHQGARSLFIECVFLRNNASSFGGAVFLADSSAPQLSACTLTDNFSATNGGGIAVQDHAHLFLEDSTVSSNSASGMAGGLLLAVHSTAVLKDSVFESNTALSEAGGVGLYDFADSYFSNVTFRDNFSPSGGALHVAQKSLVSLHGCRIASNQAVGNGAGMAVIDTARATVDDCVFASNGFTSGASAGGAVSTRDSAAIYLSRTLFMNNNAWRGGAVFLESNLSAEFVDCVFVDNIAEYDGGAMCSVGVLVVNVTGSHFAHNRAKNGSGGAVSVTRSLRFAIMDSTVDHNVAAKIGGGVSALQCALVLNNTSFIGNDAPIYGGAVSLLSTFTNTVESCEFRGNHASNGHGGALFLNSPTAFVWNNTFVQNSAFEGGAVLFVVPYNPSQMRSMISGCLFDSNVGLSTGGAIAVAIETHFYSVHADDSDESRLYHSHRCVKRDEIGVKGEVYPSPRSYAIQRNRFQNNTALNGGAIFFEDFEGSELQCKMCDFISNTAHQFGGAIYTQEDSGDTLVVNSTFAGNLAQWGGGTFAFEKVLDPTKVLENACLACGFQGTANPEGYGTSQGYATRTQPFAPSANTPPLTDSSAPVTLSYSNTSFCPGTQALNAAPFNIELGLKDGFGTHVVGAILGEANYLVTFTSSGESCWVESPVSGSQEISEDTGGTTFANITLEGKNNSTCTLSFAAGILGTDYSYSNASGIDGPHSATADLSCQVSLGGCENGQVVDVGESYDTCYDPPIWNSVTATLLLMGVLLLLLLLLLICVLCVVIVLQLYRKRQRLAEEAFYEDLEIDDDIMNMTSLDEILNDPDITRIPWHELEIIDRIGRGASGIVSSAFWRHQGELKNVAMKELTLQLEEMDEKATQDFLVEIRLMNALRHNRVVRFEGVAYHDGRLYLVTELMHYGSVKDVLLKKGRNLSWQVRTKLLHDAALGMQYLHSKKLIHRDLKPQNLLVNNKWVCKVADFGVSTIKTTTRTMTAIGTPVYMAPEVLNNERYSETADVYSFGIVLAEVFTGRQPYRDTGLNDAQLLYKIYHDALRPSTEGLPDLARRLVEEAVTREAGLRPTFAEIVLRLKRLSKLEVPVVGKGLLDGGAQEELDMGLDPEDFFGDSPVCTSGTSVNSDAPSSEFV